MIQKLKHIAIIPARKKSKGLKNKNRLLFNHTAKFIKKLSFINEVIVASDDEILINKNLLYPFTFYRRLKNNAKDNSSIKSLMQEIVVKKKLHQDTIIWLIYLTLPFKNKKDFFKALKVSKNKNFLSLISFRKAITHPFDCWVINNKIKKLIKNDIFRRQDKVPVYEHHHYLCAFKVKELKKLNSELINSNTAPIILKNNKSFLEVDTKQDFDNFLKIKNKNL